MKKMENPHVEEGFFRYFKTVEAGEETPQHTKTNNLNRCLICGQGLSETTEALNIQTLNILLETLLVDFKGEGETSPSWICGICASSVNKLVDLFHQLETLRQDFNELRRNLGHQVILGSLGGSAEVYEGWLEQVKSVEDMFPSGATKRLHNKTIKPTADSIVVNHLEENFEEDLQVVKVEDDEMFMDFEEPLDFCDYFVTDHHLEKQPKKLRNLDMDPKLTTMKPVVVLRNYSTIEGSKEDISTNKRKTELSRKRGRDSTNPFTNNEHVAQAILPQRKDYNTITPDLESHEIQVDSSCVSIKSEMIEGEFQDTQELLEILSDNEQSPPSPLSITDTDFATINLPKPSRNIPKNPLRVRSLRKSFYKTRTKSTPEDEDQSCPRISTRRFPLKKGDTISKKRIAELRRWRQCPVCKKWFDRPHRVNRHLSLVHPDSQERLMYSCEYCGEKFQDCKVMRKHTKDKHDKQTKRRIRSERLNRKKLAHKTKNKKCELENTQAHLEIPKDNEQSPPETNPEAIALHLIQPCSNINQKLPLRILRPRKLVPTAQNKSLLDEEDLDQGDSDDFCPTENESDSSVTSPDEEESEEEFPVEEFPVQEIPVDEICPRISTKRYPVKEGDTISKKRIAELRRWKQCPVCKKWFDRPCRVQHHLNVAHQGTQERILYSCKSCDQKFQDYKAMLQHAKTEHKNKPRSLEAKHRAALNRSKRRKAKRSADKIAKGNRPRVKSTRKRIPGDCQFCGKQLATQSSLKYHLKFVHQYEEGVTQAVVSCAVCRDSIGVDSLSQHIETAHNLREKVQVSAGKLKLEGDIPCGYCDLTFTTIDRLKCHRHKIHSLASEGEKTPKCPYCLRLYRETRKHRLHVREVHQVTIHKKPKMTSIKNPNSSQGKLEMSQETTPDLPKKIHCSICHRLPFATLEELEAHTTTETHLERLKVNLNVHCNVCREQFSGDTQALQDHLKSQTHLEQVKTLGDFDRKVFCVPCRVNCKSPKGLQKHNVSSEHWNACAFLGDLVPERLRRKRGIDCRLCPKKFSNANGLRKHWKKCHNNQDQAGLVCKVCGKSFTIRQDLNSHKLVHDIPKSFQCEICGIASTTKSGLQMHKYNYHSGSSSMCHRCGKTFKSKVALDVHESTVHKDPTAKNYLSPCSLCPEVLRTPYQLRRHKHLKHRKEYLKDSPHVCLVCFHVFKTSEELNNVHMAAHDYLKCPTCGKYFTVKTNLENHIRTHTGEKPFACTICDKAFRALYLLRAHEKKHPGKT